MLDIRQLEQRWLRYKIKSYAPYIFIVLALVLLIIALIYIFIMMQPSDKLSSDAKTPIEHKNGSTIPQVASTAGVRTSSQQERPVQQPKTPTQSIEVQSAQQSTQDKSTYQPKKLEPSYDFLNKITYEQTKVAPKPKPVPPKPTTPKPVPKQQINPNIAPATEKKIETILEPTAKKPVITQATTLTQTPASLPKGIKISRVKSQSEIQDIIHRFKANKSPVLGLYLARYYYKMQNYEKAYNYALSTNNIDPHIEESWLIFASSQMKLSKKAEAIKTLKAYIKSSGSLNARSLLHSIQNGEFK